MRIINSLECAGVAEVIDCLIERGIPGEKASMVVDVDSEAPAIS
jgi:hypothetical protein